MKICPNCQQTYSDDGLNFCLNDGGMLEKKDDLPPPTMVMNQARQTNPNYGNDLTQPMSSWQSQPLQQQTPPMYPQVQTPNYMSPVYQAGGDQNLPIISIILGSLALLLSLCCYAGIPFGIGAIITGFIGMNNANNNPQKYIGKNLAIGGMVTGGIGFLISLGLFLILIAG